jgi:hypothetical protein
MYLTDEEKRMLNGEHGEIVQKCMKVLVTLGEIYDAERMIEISSVHSPGVSYRVAGDAGLNYVKDASSQGCFKIPTTLNTVGIDTEGWKKIGFPTDFSLKQLELIDAYGKLGSIYTNTCTPYLVGSIPKFGEHVAWGESSAVAFVNSVIGARTNREGGPSALAAAVTGRVPYYGYHLDSSRKSKFLIQVEVEVKSDRDYAVLGYYAGHSCGKEVLAFDGIKKCPTMENLKALSAAVASSGAVALYHILGVTPEATTMQVIDDKVETLKFGPNEYRKTVEKFSYTGEVDFVVIGCPHCSIIEIRQAAALLKGKRIESDMWICTSRQVKTLADKMGYTKTIEDAGAQIVCDTCPVLCPTLERGYRNIITNSAKLAHYAPGLWNVKTALIETEDCIKAAITGKWRGEHWRK